MCAALAHTQLAQAADETLALANSLGALGTELGKLSSALSGKPASTLTAGQTGVIGFYEQKAADAKKAKAEADAKKDADEAKKQKGIIDFYTQKAADAKKDAPASTLTAGQTGVIGFYEQKAADAKKAKAEADAKNDADEAKKQKGIIDFYTQKAKDEADAKKAKDETQHQQGIMDFYAKKAKDEADAKAMPAAAETKTPMNLDDAKAQQQNMIAELTKLKADANAARKLAIKNQLIDIDNQAALTELTDLLQKAEESLQSIKNTNLNISNTSKNIKLIEGYFATGKAAAEKVLADTQPAK